MAAETSRRQALIHTALLVVLAAVAGYQYYGGTTPPPPRAGAAATARSQSPAASGPALEPVPPVRLADLNAPRPEPSSGGRNLFREKPKAPPPPPARPVTTAPPPDPNAPPPPPPPPPPITLKFIGVVQAKGGTVAVFSDGKDVFYGREGDLIEGRYKILRIGVESVEMSYADGRGRQRIPLTG
jgi:hypothetical protein